MKTDNQTTKRKQKDEAAIEQPESELASKKQRTDQDNSLTQVNDENSHNGYNDYDSSSSDEDFGPSLPSSTQPQSKTQSSAQSDSSSAVKSKKSKQATSGNRRDKRSKRNLDAAIPDKIFLDELPDFPFYNISFAHREQVTLVRTYQHPQGQDLASSKGASTNGVGGSGANKQSEFVVTGSRDGRVMFWNKMKSLASSSTKVPSISSSSSGIAGQALNETIGRIEFVKEFRAHRGPVIDAVFSPDGRYLATISGVVVPGENENSDLDKTVKIFDVLSFDMIHFFELGSAPYCICWGSAAKSSGMPKLLVGLQNDPNVYIHDLSSDTPEKPQYVLSHLHKKPVKSITCNYVLGVAISVDTVGMIEYWSPNPMSSSVFGKSLGNQKNEQLFARPTGNGWFDLKSSTNLYDYRKSKSVPTVISVSPNGEFFAAFSLPDRKVRVFDFKSGKLFREYDESLETIEDLRRLENVGNGAETENENEEDKDKVQADDIASMEKMSDSGFDKKMERDRKLFSKEHEQETGLDMTRYMNVLFDALSRFIIYSSPTGIKFVHIRSNKLVRTLGAGEHGTRFLNLALYQGFNRPNDAGKLTVEAVASDNALIQKSLVPDPVLFATAFDSPRFYLFSRIREVDDDSNEDEKTEGGNVRNVEIVNGIKLRMPKNVKQWVKDRPEPTNSATLRNDLRAEKSSTEQPVKKDIPEALKTRSATLHTTLGDIHLKFYPNVAPLAVENFVTLAERGYYDGTIFHRVIKGFMIQGGDPEGDGTGGESMWANKSLAKTHRGPTGGTWGEAHFADEFDPSKELTHKKSMVLSMANAGPGTNGSQFFITTAPAPWLDGKHTIFGAVTIGVDTVRAIENVEVGKNDRPSSPPEIISITIN